MDLQANWICGFVDGEGCFYVGINPHPEMTAGFQVLPEFVVVQHERDLKVLHALKAFFECGEVVNNHAERKAYRVRKLEHLQKKIAPFFEKHSLKTRKKVDFLKFRKILLLMEQKRHLSQGGIEEIRQIKESMNRGSLR